MGSLARLHRTTLAGIEAFPDRLEDTDTLFPQLLQELRQQAYLAVELEARAVAARALAQQGLDRLRSRMDRMSRTAALAEEADDGRSARDALGAQIEAERAAPLAQENLRQAEAAVADAREARRQTQAQFEAVQARAGAILTRARAVRSRRDAAGFLADRRPGETVPAAIARLERGLQADEAAVAVQVALAAEVQRRLDRLRAEVAAREAQP